MDDGGSAFEPRYETVIPEAIDLIGEIQREKKLEHFYLGDGMGLSLQIGHRKPADIALFTNQELNSFGIISFLGRSFEAQYQLAHNSDEMLQAVILGLKVIFIKSTEANIGEPVVSGSLRLLHKKDIAAMKLLEICRRKEAKDYVDIWYLLKEYPLEELFGFFKTKYQRADMEEVKKALCEGDKVNPYGWEKLKMLKKDIFLSDIPRDLADQVINVDKKNKKWFSFGKSSGHSLGFTWFFSSFGLEYKYGNHAGRG